MSEPSSEGDVRPGLRERKKAKTRQAIQEQAIRLFRSQGYDRTTVEQIADAADVSPSTFFRYFPTKDAVVLTDDFDPVLVERFRAQPRRLSAIQAARAAFTETFRNVPAGQVTLIEERNALVMSVPELRAAFTDSMADSARLFASLLAERTGRPETDAEVLALAGAVIGIAVASLLTGGTSLAEQLRRLEAGLALLETGFTI